ncbi:bromodomain-containing protein 1-like [Daphnia pulicaria]|uniref:bromodomain-containing protein 1-like n=1 Tax=Daphnia pulicaria TaxID=35523 RepID=UPI001EEC3D9F|nr:bromodomain-containing protein 1-like [Daphnia pulicaria]
MGLDFDIREFLNHIRATKPPYECPAKDCGKIYKSFAGIQFHLFNFNHENPGSSLPSSESPQQVLTYAEAQKIVELEIDSKLQRINIFDSISFVGKEDYENEVPMKNEETPSQDYAKTPTSKSHTPKHLQKKTPKPVEPVVRKEEKVSPPKLPEASFSIIETWSQPDAPERPKSYYRFIEKSPDEMEDEVEFDMDEDDFTWLELINKQRRFENLSEVNPESFELLMDRLEKESYFQMQSSGKDQGPPIDEDAECCICMDGECQNSNVILFCDMCNLAVHQECYGVPYIPEGQWLCRRCLQSPSRAVDCALCPNRGGAFKQTDDNRWAHVVCALWIPEVCFANTVFLEPIDSIQNIPAARWKLTCYICKQRGAGSCIQCHRANCYTAFHVTCAQQAGLHMKIDTAKDSPSSGPNISIRKAAYCDAHTPADSDSKPLVGDHGIGEVIRKAQSKAAFREKMRKARKILAEKRSAAPIISIPTIPPERVQEIASSVPQIQGKIRFIQRLIAYWTLKRQSRNGVPLLRRLQTSHPSRRPASSAATGSGSGSGLGGDQIVQPDDLLGQLRYFQRLRQDLERARLLCELIRKREKTKRELMRIKEKELELQIYPLQYLMRRLLQTLKERDNNDIFADPVDISQVPDYLDFIQQPMDFSTMQNKLDAGQYPTLEAFEKDFNLMIHNCTVYNAQHTMYYKQAIKLKEGAQVLFKQLRKDLETLVISNNNCDSSSNSTPLPPSEISQPESKVEEIDKYVSEKYRESDTLEQQLSKLEEFLRKAQQMPTGPLKVKRIRILRNELAKVRRKLSLQAGGRAAATRSSSSSPSKSRPENETRDEGSSDSDSSGSSSSGSSSSSSSSSSKSSSDSSIAGPPVKASPRSVAAARQLKIDHFITRTPKTDSDEKSTPSITNKNRLVAKVLKRNSTPASTSIASTPVAVAAIPVAAVPVTPELETIVPPVPVTPVKISSVNPQQLTGSPSGVNRRTAVLFTKKAAAAAAFKKPEPSGSTSPPRRAGGRPRKVSENSTSQPGPSGTNTSASTNLFVAAAVAATDLNKRKKQKHPESDKLFASVQQPGAIHLPNIESESFKVYRTNRLDDEEDSHRGSSESSGSEGSSSGSSSSSDSDSGDESDRQSSDDSSASPPRHQHSSTSLLPCNLIPLQPLDLVWAKCRGYPWYPALIVDPSWPRSGYVHNGVPIAIPPEEVLLMGAGVQPPAFLVLFFDAKRTWQWLPRDKLEPLGVDPDRDKAKLIESKKQTERKAVKKAFEEAILHQCRVAGQSSALSEDSDSSH